MSIDIKPRAARDRRLPAAPAKPAGATPAAGELPRLPGRRSPRWTALGILALCLGALLSYAIYARLAAETTVVSVAATVYRGEAIERSDLTTVRLRGGTLPGTVPAERLEGLVGQRAVFDLPAGAVVPAASVAATVLPAEGRAAVGVKLASGRAPAALLLPSAPVRLVALPPPSTSAGATDASTGKTYPGRVIDHAPDADGTSIVLNVDVDQAQAAAVALLAAQERIAVIRDPGR